jgi:hypothetical protein
MRENIFCRFEAGALLLPVSNEFRLIFRHQLHPYPILEVVNHGIVTTSP